MAGGVGKTNNIFKIINNKKYFVFFFLYFYTVQQY